MRINIALTSLALLMVSLLPAPGVAHAGAPAQLRLLVVNQQNAALPHATVTVYTLDGKPGVTVTTDDKGVALFPSVSTGMAQIVARSSGFSAYIDKTTVHAGVNTQTLMLRVATPRES
jgi:hypothetical protein